MDQEPNRGPYLNSCKMYIFCVVQNNMFCLVGSRDIVVKKLGVWPYVLA